MYRYTFTIPLAFNDGAAIPAAELESIAALIVDVAGGYTAHDARGAWRADDGALYDERVRVYTIDAPRDVMPALRQTAEYVARVLSQESVYITRAPILAAEYIAAADIPEGV